MRILASTLLLLILLQSYANADVSRPGPQSQPVKVALSVFLLDLDGIDNVAQNFEANVFYMATWNDPRLAHDEPGEVSRPLYEVWHPRLHILNQQKVWKTFPELVKISPSGEVNYRQQLWGYFSQPLMLHDFPFDSQNFRIPIIAAGYSPDEVEFIPHSDASSGLAQNLSVPDWEVTDWAIEAGSFSPGSELIDTMSSFTYSFTASRHHTYYLAKVIIPLILIMMMSWVVFWMDPKTGGGGQIGISVTAMLTLIAYTFTVSASIPKVPYLTRLDNFILYATILVFLALVESTVAAYQNRNGRLELARRIDKWARWVFPLAFLLLFYKTLGIKVFM